MCLYVHTLTMGNMLNREKRLLSNLETEEIFLYKGCVIIVYVESSYLRANCFSYGLLEWCETHVCWS